MLRERFLGVSTTLPSRASHPMAQSKMEPLPSTSFLSCASESSPWVLRAYQMAPAIWPMSSSMVRPIPIMVSQLSPDDCEWRRENEQAEAFSLGLCVSNYFSWRSLRLTAFTSNASGSKLSPIHSRYSSCCGWLGSWIASSRFSYGMSMGRRSAHELGPCASEKRVTPSSPLGVRSNDQQGCILCLSHFRTGSTHFALSSLQRRPGRIRSSPTQWLLPRRH